MVGGGSELKSYDQCGCRDQLDLRGLEEVKHHCHKTRVGFPWKRDGWDMQMNQGTGSTSLSVQGRVASGSVWGV